MCMTPEQLAAILMQKLQEDAASMAAEYGPMSLVIGTAAIGAVGLIWGVSKFFPKEKSQISQPVDNLVNEDSQYHAVPLQNNKVENQSAQFRKKLRKLPEQNQYKREILVRGDLSKSNYKSYENRVSPLETYIRERQGMRSF